MKTDIKLIKITDKTVQDFEAIFGKQKALPPTFPMVFYQFMDLPWQTESGAVLRKQACQLSQPIVQGQRYYCQIVLNIKRERKHYTLYSETLYLYDMDGKECAKCVSNLFTKSKLQKKK